MIRSEILQKVGFSAGAALASASVASARLATTVQAATPTPASQPTSQNPGCDPNNLSVMSGAWCAKGNDVAVELFGQASIFTTITNVLLFLVGAIAVIMLIIGGIRYIISGGNQTQVTAAKNTILYAIVGIVVAFLAYAAVNFVTQQLQP